MKQTQLYRLFFLLCFAVLPVKTVLASPYELSLYKEITYLGVGSGMALTGYLNERDRKKSTESDIDALNKQNIPAFERSFAGGWNKNVHLASDVLLLASMASPLSMLHISKKDYFTVGLMYTETLALTGGGMALAKGSITRYRPYAYGDNAPIDERLHIDTKRSFFSGHAALASSGLIFTATTFSDYHPDSKYKKHIWTGAITGSLLISGLRVAGGKHFPSDVITGLIWGSAIGYAVPASHRKKSAFQIMPFMNDVTRGLYFSRLF